MEESAQMAETAIVYKNVADGLDTVEESTDSIISTMKAFGIESNDTMGIIDRFNEVGNNFAITSAGIGEALQRSASALYAGGNTIDESIALVTAANSVIQNPEQVGTALKTLTLRIRGVKTELEDAGLETEGMAETTSQLQAKLKALTHGEVDIMLNADTFKNTTQILREMSAAWEDMTDVERAASLELIGGKRQANILSSLISNFETVEEVIESSMNSSGSAMAENEKWMSSIAGKSEKLSNNMQALWNNTLNSDVIKGFYNLAIAATDLVKDMGLIPPVLAAVLVYFKLFKKVSPVSLFRDFSTNVRGFSTAIQQVQQMTNLGLNKMTMSNGMLDIQSVNAYSAAVAGMSAKQQAAILTTNGLNKSQAAQILVKNGVKDATIRETLGQEALNAAKVQSAVLTGAEIKDKLAEQGVSKSSVVMKWLESQATEELTRDKILAAIASGAFKGATDQEIAALLGLVGVTNTASFSIKGLGKAMWAVMASNPLGWIITLISLVSIGISKIKQAKEEAIRAAEETVNAYKEAQNTLKDQKKTIDEVSDSYEKLSKGVNVDTNENVSLTTESYKEYLEVCNNIADMFPNLVTGYDEQGNAILSLKGNVDQLTQAYKDAAQSARAAMIAGGNDVFDVFADNYDNNIDWIFGDSGLKQQLTIAKKLQELISNNDTKELIDFFNTAGTGRWFEIDGESFNNVDMLDVYEAIGINTSNNQPDFIEGNSINLDKMQAYASKINSFITSMTSKINAETSKVKSLMDAYLGEDLDYTTYSEETRSFIDQIVSNLDADFIRSFKDKGGPDALYAWIDENIVDAFENPAITDAMSKVSDIQLKFNTGDATYDDYKKAIEDFYAQLNALQNSGALSEDAVVKIKAAFVVDSYDSQIEVAKGLLDSESGEKAGVLTKAELDAVDKYADEWEKLDTAKMTLDELREKIKEVRVAAGEFSVSNMIDDVAGIQESFSKLGDAYEDFKDNGIVTAESLAKIKESFGNVEDFDKYIAVLGNSSSSMEDVKNALSGLATKYLEASGVLNDLTEENEQFVISQLKAFGVTNAEEYIANIRKVQEAMNENYEIDLSNFSTVEQMKLEVAGDLYEEIIKIENDKIEEQAKQYGVDLENYKSVAQQKIAIAAEVAKAEALSLRQEQKKEALNATKAARETTKVGKDEIEGRLGGDKLVGKSYAEVYRAYYSGEYKGEYWESQVYDWLKKQGNAIYDAYSTAADEADKLYEQEIQKIEKLKNQSLALEDYVAQYNPQLSIDSSKLGGPDSSNSKSSTNEFEETIDWVEIRLEEVNEQLDLMNAKLENAGNYASKNNIIDQIIGVNNTKMSNLLSGIKKYSEYAAKALADVPAKYRDAAQNGAIAITDFVGEANESTVKAIEKYREWAQKVADLNKQLEDTNKEIRELYLQKIDNAEHSGSVKDAIEDAQTAKLQAAVDYDETRGMITDPRYYAAMMENSERSIAYLTSSKKAMQKAFDEALAKGLFKNKDGTWNDFFYEELEKLYNVDAEIATARKELEEFQNAINEISVQAFDELIKRFDYLSEEAQGLIDIMSEKDLFIKPDNEKGWGDSDVAWTDEGLATLGLHAQEMERAEEKAKVYAERIRQLTAEYKDGHYSESEYREELNNLTQAQFDAIKAAQDEKDAIVDLNKERIDAVKEGIEKQIESYKELIDTKKEELDVEKD